MGTKVTISEKTAGIAALEKEKDRLFAESEAISKDQADALHQFKTLAARHNVVLVKIIAIEEMQSKILRPL